MDPAGLEFSGCIKRDGDVRYNPVIGWSFLSIERKLFEIIHLSEQTQYEAVLQAYRLKLRSAMRHLLLLLAVYISLSLALPLSLSLFSFLSPNSKSSTKLTIPYHSFLGSPPLP